MIDLARMAASAALGIVEKGLSIALDGVREVNRLVEQSDSYDRSSRHDAGPSWMQSSRPKWRPAELGDLEGTSATLRARSSRFDRVVAEDLDDTVADHTSGDREPAPSARVAPVRARPPRSAVRSRATQPVATPDADSEPASPAPTTDPVRKAPRKTAARKSAVKAPSATTE